MRSRDQVRELDTAAKSQFFVENRNKVCIFSLQALYILPFLYPYVLLSQCISRFDCYTLLRTRRHKLLRPVKFSLLSQSTLSQVYVHRNMVKSLVGMSRMYPLSKIVFQSRLYKSPKAGRKTWKASLEGYALSTYQYLFYVACG